ncbi:MAG: homocysteine methyltransferase, partial [Prolixibacteraceae bacterium]|nr:homocysteine methyltransferase [Burkholderiales bacterium]
MSSIETGVAPDLVIDLIESFRRSKTMFVAVALGVFDHLAAGPAFTGEIAAALTVDSAALERLLDGCVTLRLLHKEDGRYANTPIADKYLRRDSPETLSGYIRYSDRALWSLWGNLEGAVREGSARWDQTFGSRGALFANFFSTEESKREFLAGMHGFGVMSSPSVVAAFDLGGTRHLVDLGGATGHLAIAACEKYPNMRATVFDLPEVLNVTSEYVAAAGLADRIDLAGGDFFLDELPGGDLFALGRILHDWSEERVHLLLAKIYRCLPAGGALIVAEKLLDDDKSGPVSALMQSLNMLVCTEGKER